MVEVWRLMLLGRIHPIQVASVYDVVGRLREKDEVDDTLIIYRPDKPLVCVGYHQDVYMEVNTEYCKTHNIPYTRRITGGGAVYLDPEQVCFSVITKKSYIGRYNEAYVKYLDGAVEALKILGIPASFRPKNDIESCGRKIAGCSATWNGRTLIMGNTLLASFNPEKAVKALKIPTEKFSDKAGKTLASRVTSIKEILGHRPSFKKIEEALKEGYRRSLNIELEHSKPSSRERYELKKSIKEYTSTQWINLRTCSGFHRHADYKTRGGLIRVSVSIANNVIQAAYITGDYFIEPRNAINGLEAWLKWTSATEKTIDEEVKEYFNKNSVVMHEMSPEDFAEAVKKAALS